MRAVQASRLEARELFERLLGHVDAGRHVLKLRIHPRDHARREAGGKTAAIVRQIAVERFLEGKARFGDLLDAVWAENVAHLGDGRLGVVFPDDLRQQMVERIRIFARLNGDVDDLERGSDDPMIGAVDGSIAAHFERPEGERLEARSGGKRHGQRSADDVVPDAFAFENARHDQRRLVVRLLASVFF